MRYLIGYDIANAKRLSRMYRRITKFATPLQYSLFLFDGSKQELNRRLKTILPILNKKEDDLRIYPLPAKTPFWELGKSAMPEGIIWGAVAL